MDGPTMSDSSPSRRFSLKSFWPWPGTVLLVLFAAWLFYMGSITSDGDVRTSLYGLGAASIVLILLALRSANLGAGRTPRAERKTRGRRATPEIEPEIPTYALVEDEPAAPGEPAVGAGSLDNVEPLPQSRTPARHRRERRDEGDEAEYEEERPAPRRQPAQVYELDLDEDDIIEALDHLRAMINREKAERGAQIARIDAALANRSEGAMPVVARESAVGLEERLNQYLTIPAFNNAMHQKVFPRIAQIVESALQEMLTPERRARLAEAAGESAPRSTEAAEHPRTLVGGEHDDDAAAAGAAEVHAALQAHIDAATADRDLLREEVRGARQMAERAVRLINRRLGDAAAEGVTGGGSLTGTVEAIARQQEADRSDIAALRNAINELRLQAVTGGSGDGEGDGGSAASSLVDDIKRDLEAAGREAVQRVEQRIASFEELNTTVSDVVERLNVVDKRQKALSKRLLAQEQTGGEGGGGPSEVEALRQALTEVMQQTSDIRARQDAIAAKLDSTPDAT